MVYLHITFTVEAQNVPFWEDFYEKEFAPVIRDHGFEAVGLWKTLVGNAGEFTEIWKFENLTDYERKWKTLMNDEHVQEIFKTTGPLVKNETFKLMEMMDSSLVSAR